MELGTIVLWRHCWCYHMYILRNEVSSENTCLESSMRSWQLEHDSLFRISVERRFTDVKIYAGFLYCEENTPVLRNMEKSNPAAL